MKKILLVFICSLTFIACKHDVSKGLQLYIDEVKKNNFTPIPKFIENQEKVLFYKDATNLLEAREVFTNAINDSLVKLDTKIDLLSKANFTTREDKISGYIDYTHNYFSNNYMEKLSSDVSYSYRDNHAWISYSFDVRDYSRTPYINNVQMLINDTLRLTGEVTSENRHISHDLKYESIYFTTSSDFGKSLNDNLSTNIQYRLSGSSFSRTKEVSIDDFNAMMEVRELYLLLKNKKDLVTMKEKVILYTE